MVGEMSKTYVPVELRRFVEDRANHCCEYCGVNGKFTGLAFAIDHIISEVHGGETLADNLAYACGVCNHLKHANLAGYLPELMLTELDRRTFLLRPIRLYVYS
jgi:5-methylcytosine-specific restriction endonuclease McrA